MKLVGLFALALIILPAASTTGAPAPADSASAPVSDHIEVGASDGATPGSSPPTKEEWAKAPRMMGSDGKPVGASVGCDTFVLRGWVHLTCKSLSISSDVASALGAVWGVAGALDDVKAEVTLVGADALSGLMKEAIPTVRNMAASVDITFPVRPGNALLLEVSGARWGFEEYNGNFFTGIDKGFLVDVSWALGEKTPTLIFSPP